jgi:molecular chaperone GrpE
MCPQDSAGNAAEYESQSEAQPAAPGDELIRPDGNGHFPAEPATVFPNGAPSLPAEPVLRLAAIEEALLNLTLRFAGESDRALARERVIDRQHEEIERLRSIERAGQLRPVVTDLCRLRNGLRRQAGTVPAEMTGSQVANLLDSFAATVEETLERCGIAVLPCAVDAAFESKRHRVVGVVEIDDPGRDGTVAEVLQDGYAEIDGGKVVVEARIRLHRYLSG